MPCLRKMQVKPMDAVVVSDEKHVKAHGNPPTVGSSGSARLEDRVIVVRPEGRAVILEGSMVLRSRRGTALLHMRWPLLLCCFLQHGCTILGILAHAVSFVRMPLLATEDTVAGNKKAAVVVRHTTEIGLTLQVVCLMLALTSTAIILHGIHVPLFTMCLKNFDPWVMTACAIRLQSSLLYSKWALTGDYFDLTFDIMSMVIVLQALWMVILLDSACISLSSKHVVLISAWLCVAASVAASSFTSASTSPNWDPDAELDILWLAPMEPIQQFKNSLATIFVLLSKGVWNMIIKRRHFMFLSVPLGQEDSRVNVWFAELDSNDDGVVDLVELSTAIKCRLGLPQAHCDAAFQCLDCDRTGEISFRAFRATLLEQLDRHPSFSLDDHLMLLCKTAIKKFSCPVSFSLLLKSVIEQWNRVPTQDFGNAMYASLMSIPSIAEHFLGKNMAAQALQFGSMVQAVISVLKHGNLIDSEKRMRELGGRHVKYQVHISQIPIFQNHMVKTMKHQLGESGVDLYAWSVVWQHAFMDPFVHGWLAAANLQKDHLLDLAMSSLEDLLTDAQSFGRAMCEIILEKIQLCPWIQPSTTGMQDATDTLVSFILGFLQQFLRFLMAHDSININRELKCLSKLFAGQNTSMLALHCFAQAFQEVVCVKMKERVTSELLAAWTYIWQIEIIYGCQLLPHHLLKREIHDMMQDTRAAQISVHDLQSLIAGKLQLQKEAICLGLNDSELLSAEGIKKALLSLGMMFPCSDLRETICYHGSRLGTNVTMANASSFQSAASTCHSSHL